MKFSTTQFLTTLGLASIAAADFHILTGPCSIAPGFGGSLEDYAVACPSNYYNCDCMLNGDRTGHVINGETPVYGITTTGSNYFELDGMCGVGNMNFYLQDDGTWLFYIAGGDGSVQGTCYAGDNSITESASLEAGTGCWKRAGEQKSTGCCSTEGSNLKATGTNEDNSLPRHYYR